MTTAAAPPKHTFGLETALRYAERGWKIVPLRWPVDSRCSCKEGVNCGSPAKHPLTENGFHDASADPEVIRRWWARWPRANIGIRTGAESGIIVLDVDSYMGGEESLADLSRDKGPLPPGPEVQSGGGGRHLYFKHPGIRVTKGKLSPGLDLQADGALIVAPFSEHVSGRRYSWDSDTKDLPLPDMPPWLIELANKRQQIVSMSGRRAGPDGDVTKHFQVLEKLLGPAKRQGKWTMFKCPWHADGQEWVESLGITPDGWGECFGCGERGWIDTLIHRLQPHGNNFSDTDDALQGRVVAALEERRHRLAIDVASCGREWTLYKCEENLHQIAYPIRCKSPFCPTCRSHRLAVHLAEKRPHLEELTHPIGITITPQPLDRPDHPKEAVLAQTATLMDALREVSDAVPQLKSLVRAVSGTCKDSVVQARHAVVMADPGERGRALIVTALRKLNVSIEVQRLDDPARWLHGFAADFDFGDAGDLEILVDGFKGIRLLTGWGAMKPVTGGMLKGKGQNHKPSCPVCGAPLLYVGRGPKEQTVFVEGKGYFGWTVRGPPR